MSLDVANIETQLVAVLGAITVDAVALKVYDHEPTDVDRLPAATLYAPDIARAGVDTPDIAPMGTVGWVLDWKLRLYFDLSNAKRAQDQAKAVVGDAIKAIDANPGLNNALFETRLLKATSSDTRGSPRPLQIYECDLSGFYFV